MYNENGKIVTETLMFTEFLEKTERKEGIVLLGAGGDPYEWIYGVHDILYKNEIAVSGIEEVFSEAFILTTSGGRTDIALVFAENNKLDLGKLAMWRLRFGDCSWISDYKVNYEHQH